MKELKNRKTRLWFWMIVLALVPVAVLASWAGTEYLIERSSDEVFCTGCHTMQAVGASYAKTKHGGNNRLGIKVKCAECHLPQDSHLNYVYTKAKTGLRDMWLQLAYDENNPADWKAKRKNRHHYVFDSGCTKCHSEKLDSQDPSHPAYFAGGQSPFKGQGKFSCVDCHFYVGHSDASEWLQAETSK